MISAIATEESDGPNMTTTATWICSLPIAVNPTSYTGTTPTARSQTLLLMWELTTLKTNFLRTAKVLPEATTTMTGTPTCFWPIYHAPILCTGTTAMARLSR